MVRVPKSQPRFVFLPTGPRGNIRAPPTMPVEQEPKRPRRDEAVPMETEAGSVPVRPAAAAAPAHENFSPELLRIYYDRIFPAQLMCRWLSYGTQQLVDATEQLLHRREFSFTTGDDVYIRYLSFEDAAGLKKELAAKLPHKIDIGAIFSAAPRDHKKYKLFEPVQREMIIDIDLTDYDFLEVPPDRPARPPVPLALPLEPTARLHSDPPNPEHPGPPPSLPSCSPDPPPPLHLQVDVKRLETCDRCWPLMALAMRVLERALRDDFGFEHILCVYSGRRGIHLWACDTRARLMPNEVRGAVADYLGPMLNPATGRLRIAKPLHPALKRAYEEELQPFFMGTMLPHEVGGGEGSAARHPRTKTQPTTVPTRPTHPTHPTIVHTTPRSPPPDLPPLPRGHR